MRVPTALLAKFASDIRASYWFIPAVLVAASVVLLALVSFIDRNASILPIGLPDTMLSTQAGGARAVLTVIASAVIGVAGVMFSVTIVAVSFASGKYGPRLIGNFMRDRGNQWSLGILIATFVYALLALREVHSDDGGDSISFVPQYGLWVAILLALLAVGTMIYFVHHIPETINVSRITATLGHRLCAAVRQPDLVLPEVLDEAVPAPFNGPPIEIKTRTSGYIQTADMAGMVAVARELSAHVTLLMAPGAFVAAGDTVIEVQCDTLPDPIREELCRTLALGNGPSEDQNAACIADQLVEMVVRALSPGVNDPFTANDCLNWLYAALVSAAEADNVQPRDHPFLTVPRSDFARLLDTSFGACAPYVASDEMTLAHLRDLLTRLRTRTSSHDKSAVTRLLNTLPD